MNLLAFEWSQWVVGLMVVLFLFISVCMVLIVLIQRPQGGGLSGAFGGGGAEGAGQTAFGAKTGDVLTTVTIGIFVVFLGIAVALNYVVRPPAAAPVETIGAAPVNPAKPETAPATAPAPAAQQPGTDGKFRLTTEKGGQIESVVPVEVVKDPSQLGDNVKHREMELDPRTGVLTPVQPQTAPGAAPATPPPAG